MINYFLNSLVNNQVSVVYRIQPVYVADVASAVVAALKDDGNSMGKTYELGGPDVYTLHQLVIINSLLSCSNQV